MWQLKSPILLEAGPGRTLGLLAMQHPDRTHAQDPVTIASLRHFYENQSDVEFLMHSIGKLWLSGADIKWESLHPGRRPRRVSLPTYPFERQHYWTEAIRVPVAAVETQASVQKNSEISSWFYSPSWKRLLSKAVGVQETPPNAETRRTWLFYADDQGFASQLMTRLQAANQDVVAVRVGPGYQQVNPRSFVIEAGNSQHYDRVIRALQAINLVPDCVVHAWSVTGHNQTQAGDGHFKQAQELGFYSLLLLAKTLAKQNVRNGITLFALSDNIQEVNGKEPLRPEKSTLLGPCLVIPQEYPNIRVKSIDVEWSENTAANALTIDQVVGEFFNPGSELFVAYRNAQRWIQSYEPIELENAGPANSIFRAGGVYLITGGLGNIGCTISRYLAKNYGAKLVLTGRSSLPDGESTDRLRDKISRIAAIEELGAEVLYLKASVADADAMRGVIQQAYQRFGNLHGVIHGAGVIGDAGYREIKDSNEDNCDAHFQAKAHGLLVLEDLLRGEKLDFCLLLSSLTSVLGGIGQAGYASSNIYMDTFARNHNRSSPVPWLSVNWDVWRVQNDVGPESGLGKTLEALGMSAEEATAALETALSVKNASQLVVSTGDLNARISQWIKLESLGPGRHANQASSSQSTLSQRPNLQTDYEPPSDETEQQIARIWQDALGIDKVGINDHFSDLGGHSLLAIKIVSGLRKAFQIDLPVRALFDAPTVADLSSYIEEQIINEIEALSDEEARQLVSNR
jgi:acyl transferase domain-containing protein